MSFWVAGAVVGAGVIGAVGSNIAAGKQASAQEQAAATQLQMFDTINKQEQPFIQGGYGAESRLTDLLGLNHNTRAPGWGSLTKSFSPTDFLQNLDPGYQFQLQTGAQATRNADTPGVGSLSGAALKDLMGFNQSMAATGYQNAFNRFTTQQNNVFNRLYSIASLGQNAATQTGNAGAQLGTGIAQAQAAAGGSQAAGIVGASNALGGSATGLAYLMSGQNGGAGYNGVNTGSYDPIHPSMGPAFNQGDSGQGN
jgi:hypothetical protein